MKRFLSIILALSTLFSLTGCFTHSEDTNTDSSSSRYQIIEKIDMIVDYEENIGYTINIKGNLKNTTNEIFSHVGVTFVIYDKDGNQIETAVDNMNYLLPGDVWSFTARMFGPIHVEPKSFKLVEINAW